MPVVLGILFFTAVPVIYAFICSFFETPLKAFSWTDWGTFVGLKNYTKNFTVYLYRKTFFKSLEVTFLYAIIYIPLSLVLSFGIALLLNQNLKGMRIYRVIYYLPVIIPAVCSGLLWDRLTDSNWGIMNSILEAIGITNFGWFDKENSSMASFIFINLFTLGSSMIMWIAQLKNVPNSLYESARLDGAGKVRTLISITIPLCSPMILYNLIMSIIGVMQTYAQVITLTGGAGVNRSLLFYVVNIYDYRVSEFGYACALSFILFAIIAALTLIAFRLSKNRIYYAEEN